MSKNFCEHSKQAKNELIRFQITLTVPSSLAEANCDPSGLISTQFTASSCPSRVFVIWPEARSQTFKFKKWRSVWLHHRMKRKAQLIFTITELSWVSKEYSAPAPEANFVPSGLKATQRTAALCPLKSFRTWPEARFQTCTNEHKFDREDSK